MNKARKKREEQIQALAQNAFERHKLIEYSPTRWVIARVGPDNVTERTFWTEIVALGCCRFVVHGDITPVLFQSSYQGERGIHWAAKSHPDYLAGKVIPYGRARAEDVDVALADLQEWYREAEHDSNPSRELVDEAVHELKNRGKQLAAVKQDLFDGGEEDTEWLDRLGRVIDADFYYSHAALKRLSALLEELEPVPKTTAGAAT